MSAVNLWTRTFILVLCVALAGCQSASGGKSWGSGWSSDQAGGEVDNTLANFNRLVSRGKYIEASELYNRNSVPFFRDYSSTQASLKQVADGVRKALTPEFQSAEQALAQVDWSAPKEQWPSIRNSLTQARSALADYASHKVMALAAVALDGAFPHVDDLRNQIQNVEYSLYAGAGAAYAAYDQEAAVGFFDAYPVDFDNDARELLQADQWGEYLSKVAATGKASWMHEDKRKAFTKDKYKERLAAARNEGLVEFAATLRAISEMKQYGFRTAELVDGRIRVVDVTGEELLEANHIDFTVGVNPAGSAGDAKTSNLDEAFAGRLAKDLDIVVIYDVSEAKADRRVVRRDKVSSEFEAEKIQEPNPAYQIAKFELEQAVREQEIKDLDNRLSSIRRQRSGYNSGLSDGQALGALLGGAILGSLFADHKSDIDKAKEKLAGTPPYVYRSIYQGYELTKTTITAKKQARGTYYIVDRRTNTYIRDTFEIQSETSFPTIKGLHPRDRHKNMHRSGAVAEDDIASFEDGPEQIALSKLIQDVLADDAKPKPTGGRSALLKRIADEKRQIAAAFQSQQRRAAVDQYDARPVNDDRIESVVFIVNPGESQGSGFFIREDLVLTNAHVVKGSRFVEIITHGGQESFGKVIASDERRDLALVKIAARGNPLKLFSGRTLPLGEEVLAIGHPHGLDFTFTRGVLSSVRKIPSRSMPDAEEVRVVQTDAAINPGNSGGPLFLDDWVIGVNTWVLNADYAQGIAFAVHYAEVLNFLAEHGIAD